MSALLLAVLAVAGLVDDESTLLVGSRPRVFEQKLDPALVNGLSIPRRLGEELLQALGLLALRSYDGLGVGEGGEGLVALGVGSKSPSR